jgi:hypothetical protein
MPRWPKTYTMGMLKNRAVQRPEDTQASKVTDFALLPEPVPLPRVKRC